MFLVYGKKGKPCPRDGTSIEKNHAWGKRNILLSHLPKLKLSICGQAYLSEII
jgi:hypothetical protein